MQKMIQRLFLLVVGMLFVQQAVAQFSVYVWQSWGDSTTAQSLQTDFERLKARGVKGVCLNTGFSVERATIGAKAAKAAGLEFHAWMPCMLQDGLPASWYGVNRLGEPANEKQAYVPYYKCLDPNNPEVQEWLISQYEAIASIPEVDYVQLDYIRYPDVILAKGLWKKFNLVMHEEYPVADYCYCDRCVADFKAQTGIDIRAVKDPAKVKAWAQFRCDIITRFVNRLVARVHAKGKKMSADVFPGPRSHAVKMVRQEWDKWQVDAFFPMNYNDFYLQPASWVGKMTKEEVRAAGANRPVYSGLFICKNWQNKAQLTDPEDSGLLPSEVATAVRGARKAGAKGICLFSAQSMTEAHWQALEEVLKEQ